MKGSLELGAWAQQFSGSLLHLWDGIRSSAKTVVESGPDDLGRNTDAFLFGVGNFKRQSPIHPPGGNQNNVPTAWEAPRSVELWGGISVARDDAATWCTLTSIRGVGVPTATTILAALWPTRHGILDVLTVQVAVGLLGRAGDWGGPVPENDAHSSSPPRFNRTTWLTWPTYSWYRAGLSRIASGHQATVQEAERAFFELAKWQFRHQPAPQQESWADYGERLEEILASPPPQDQ